MGAEIRMGSMQSLRALDAGSRQPLPACYDAFELGNNNPVTNPKPDGFKSCAWSKASCNFDTQIQKGCRKTCGGCTVMSLQHTNRGDSGGYALNSPKDSGNKMAEIRDAVWILWQDAVRADNPEE